VWILNRAAQPPRKLPREITVPVPSPNDLNCLRGSDRLKASSLIQDLHPTPARSSLQVFRDRRIKNALGRTGATDD